jgi:hypothetical protein
MIDQDLWGGILVMYVVGLIVVLAFILPEPIKSKKEVNKCVAKAIVWPFYYIPLFIFYSFIYPIISYLNLPYKNEPTDD